MRDLVDALAARGLRLTTAESCTGGLIGAGITAISGASTVFERGFVTYSYRSKIDMLGVNADTIAAHGAVSEQVAREMAIGALKYSRADIAVSVTGIAGPNGGSHDKPIGLVYIAAARREDVHVSKHNFTGNRDDIRRQTVTAAVAAVMDVLTR